MVRRNHIMMAGVAAVSATAIALTAVAISNTENDAARLTASSSAPGSNLGALQSAPFPGSEETTTTKWKSDRETLGAWVQWEWSDSRAVNFVQVGGADGEDLDFAAAILSFSDGSSLHITPDEEGNVELAFPERTVSLARLTFAQVPEGAEAVGLSSLMLDDSGEFVADRPGAAGSVSATALVGGSAREAAELSDGDIASGETGAEWTAGSAERRAEVTLAWNEPREIASVQIFGPSGSWTDPAYTAAAPLNGRLLFDDGSSVRVSGVAGGSGPPTTIAFTPRIAESVRLELVETIEQAEIALREFAVYERGVTPPRWPSTQATEYSTGPPDRETCDAPDEVEADAAPGDARLALVCPTVGASVEGQVTVTVDAPPGAELEATTWVPGEDRFTGSIIPVAHSAADDSGRATLELDSATLPHGPFAVRVAVQDGQSEAETVQPLYVQLYNADGVALESRGFAPAGMTLQWDEDFDQPLSISQTGEGATYAATKPAYWGTSEFGDAVFANPAWKEGTLSTLQNDYLRVRVQPIGDRDDASGWDRRHLGGILSSLHVGASGFSAQYGYYEARMLGAPGRGTWPAFWMLNTDSATRASDTSAEVDAVELYGHSMLGSCHAIHNWREGQDDGEVECLDPNGYSDWGLAWHTYGVRIGPDGADFYIDGSKVLSLPELSHTNEPFYFMVNLALGGGWPIDLSPTGDVVDLYVDYVRVYT